MSEAILAVGPAESCQHPLKVAAATGTTICIPCPDDFHHHLRDGIALNNTVAYAARSFERVVAMPNLDPPLLKVQDALEYNKRIQTAAADANVLLSALLVLYLTDSTTLTDIDEAAKSGQIMGFKLYPRGATTHSTFGVSNASRLMPIFQRMASANLVLLIHCESTCPEIDVFDREEHYIREVVSRIISEVPHLRIVLEHISTAFAVEFVLHHQHPPKSPNIAATITPHHLLLNRSDLLSQSTGLNPHMYCKPILQDEQNRRALLAAATSGNNCFFIGTDCAPHPIASKHAACCSAGIFHSPFAMELYAEAFDSVGCIDKLEGFASRFGQSYYGIEVNLTQLMLTKVNEQIFKPDSQATMDQLPPDSSISQISTVVVSSASETLAESSLIPTRAYDTHAAPNTAVAFAIPPSFPFGDSVVVPLWAGRTLLWTTRKVCGKVDIHIPTTC